ncbi:trypsin-like peptidase domain-containing protein [Patulibacter brassicae]|uniref:Trypsin-like peptidase domain-containing protein n=1 Tax=Patulibacter brassicae TaxID=1705717 RepID=A0ABU4VKF2_9ACTN|nr:trypsin-like peptidase domain-containing protein [Patulibacter brassicae]MDX8152308.1 trypsin-like peptidase domain-containing protein [Patulibacter brassicae]
MPDRRSLWNDNADEDRRWLDGEPPSAGSRGPRGGEEPTAVAPPRPSPTPSTPPTAPHDARAATAPHEPRPERAPRRPLVAGPLIAGTRALRAAVAIAALALVVAGITVGMLLGSSRTEDVTLVNPPNGNTAAPLKGAYDAARDGVVQIRTSSGSGTGWVYDGNGTIVTNAHVIDGSRDVRVRFDDDGPLIRARTLGTDVSSDLAVLKVDPSDAPKLTVLKLGDSSKVEAGDPVLAIGFPLGLERTATAGIISGIGRQIQAQNGFSIDRVIQTDAPINPGNSGGPLLDVRGRVIGVNSQIATSGAGSNGNIGIGFAVPSETVANVVPTLAAGREVRHAWLGISMAELPGVDGVALGSVVPGGPAGDAGLRASSASDLNRGEPGDGDVITRVDGQQINRDHQVSAIVNGKKPGDTIEIEVERNGDRRTVEVRLGERPAAASGSSSGGGSGGGGSLIP